MRLVALDLETANADMASICSIGFAVFEGETLAAELYSLIDPRDLFDPINVSIHSIDAGDVRGAPTFKDATPEIERWLDGQLVVTHPHFDRVAIRQAACRHSVKAPTCNWLDSSRVARRVWSECAK